MAHLERPNHRLVSSYLSFVEDMRAAGEKIWDGHVPKENESPESFVDRKLSQETQTEEGLVTASEYWLIEKDEVVGRISLRHRLNDFLRDFGGHIGYEVRPSARRKGFAKEMLRLVLQTPKAKEIAKLLLTCDPTNVGSNKTITANGGVLAETRNSVHGNRPTNYYWVQL